MTDEEIKEMLEETGFPVAQDAFDEQGPESIPYIAFRTSYTQNIYADNRVYAMRDRIEIELCMEYRESKNEKKLADVLDNRNINWEKTSDDFLLDEEVFSINYEFWRLRANG